MGERGLLVMYPASQGVEPHSHGVQFDHQSDGRPNTRVPESVGVAMWFLGVEGGVWLYPGL